MAGHPAQISLNLEVLQITPDPLKAPNAHRDSPPPSTMPRGRKAGAQNYKNNLLIPIVERELPTGAEGWAVVAGLYKEASGEAAFRDRSDLRNHWFEKLCNCFKAPTGRKGEDGDHINRCIRIERQIMAKTDSGLLGGSESELELEVRFLPEDVEDEAQYSDTSQRRGRGRRRRQGRQGRGQQSREMVLWPVVG